MTEVSTAGVAKPFAETFLWIAKGLGCLLASLGQDVLDGVEIAVAGLVSGVVSIGLPLSKVYAGGGEHSDLADDRGEEGSWRWRVAAVAKSGVVPLGPLTGKRSVWCCSKTRYIFARMKNSARELGVAQGAFIMKDHEGATRTGGASMLSKLEMKVSDVRA